MSEKVYFFGKHKDKYFLVDNKDLEKVRAYKWYLGGGTISRIEYVKGSEAKSRKTNSLILSRLILNAEKEQIVDHIDGNIFNNTRKNLRIVNRAQNAWNNHVVKAKSGFKGVYKSGSGTGKKHTWESKICCKGKRIYLGCFKTKEDAARTYNEAAKKYFGEYACLNKI